MEYKWNIKNKFDNDFWDLIKRDKGFNEEQLNSFINIKSNKFHNPNKLPNIESAINRTKMAIKNKEKIMIAGDYDCDGVTATSIMVMGLSSVGANVDCKPEHLYQFGVMGLAYAKDIMGIKKVKVGILANGEEDTKGNEVTKEAAAMLKSMPEFIGNVEGNNIFDGSVHVIVCDGFVGNIVLKTSEGVADTIGKFMKHHIKKSAFASFGSVFMRKVFSSLKQQIDYAEYGGAPLLGINGAAIVSHGKSNPKAIKNAIFQAINFVKSDVNKHIKASLETKN